MKKKKKFLSEYVDDVKWRDAKKAELPWAKRRKKIDLEGPTPFDRSQRQ